MLEKWRNAGTSLNVHLAGRQGESLAVISAISGTVIRLSDGSEHFDVDIREASFNGDARETAQNKGAYLVCELPDGSRHSFRAPCSV
jgi:hypothetical protein